MRKNLLALSIAAMIGGIAGTANAQVVADSVATISNAGKTGLNGRAGGSLGTGTYGGTPAAATRLSPTSTGIGHILVVPYFTTQGNNTSLLNIVNTDEVNGKAVKLRYRGASNSDDVFDITIYLSPADMWSASVVRGADGVSQLITNDTSCTLPSKAAIKEKDGKFQLTRVRAANPAETREGYIEILNTADIPPTLVNVNGARTPTANALFNAIKHTNGVPTCASAVMDLQENALNDVDQSENRWFTRGYTFPTGRLSANWTIADVAKKSVQTGEAVAIKATPTNIIDEPGSANLVWFPQTTQVVAARNAAALTADPLLARGVIKAAMYDFPDLSTPYTTPTAGAYATPSDYTNDVTSLAAMLETQTVVNEFITSGTGATEYATDWVFTMPTRRYAVAVNYATAAGSLVFNDSVNRHFGSRTVGTVTTSNVSLVNGQACVDAGAMRAWDREETTRTTFVISPDANVRFCGEASVIAFNNKPSAMAAELAVNKIDTKFAEGWMRINTPGYQNTTAAPVGLPVVGFAAVTYGGGALGGTWAHRARPTTDR